MPSIESLGHPLVYRVNNDTAAVEKLLDEPNMTTVRASIRALEGMQKEALVEHGPTDTLWRMVSDEGPYLNGTDLAPFPLAFYSAGMAFSFLEEFLNHAAANAVSIESLELTQDNYYTMEGSALRGDMIGGALPAEIHIEIHSDASPDTINDLIQKTITSSPAQAYMHNTLENTFALCNNGTQLPVKRVTASAVDLYDDPHLTLDAIQPLGDETYMPDIIVKREAAESVFGVEGGAGSSLKSEQKRTLHVGGIASLRDDGLREFKVQLFKPIGSVFRFISDPAGQKAPSSLSYLSAGIGFCFMTQLGRYAHIVKKPLESYSIVQDTVFRVENGVAENDPVDTHVIVRFDQSEEDAQQLVDMSEQTCFLHAAMRTASETKVSVSLNGKVI